MDRERGQSRGGQRPHWQLRENPRDETSESPHSSRSRTSVPSHNQGSSLPFKRGGYTAHPRADTYHQSENPVPILKYRIIKDMVKDESVSAQAISIRLSTKQSGFEELLRQNLKGGMIQMLLKLFGKLCKEEQTGQSFVNVLHKIANARFMENSNFFLHSLITERQSRKSVAHIHVSNSLHLAKAFLIHIPGSSAKQVSMLLVIVKDVVNQLSLHHSENIDYRLNEIVLLLDEFQGHPNKMSGKQSQSNETDKHNEEPPDDFRQISIFPQQADIHTSETPFIRTNLVSSAYRDENHYLDVQFRLLREDFVRPLREGINYYRNKGGLGNSRKQIAQHVKVYDNVTIEYPKPWRTGVVHCVHFDPSRFGRVRWQNSKRLMFGNLVCLSHDNFEEHLLFGTVVDRKPELLSDGYLLLEFVHSVDQKQVPNLAHLNINDSDDLDDNFEEHEPDNAAAEQAPDISMPTIDMEKSYTMVESEAYFEAYKHVLVGLQGTTRIPLERYIIQCKSDIRFPAHLQRTATNFSFSPVILDRTANILRGESDWPTAEEMQLDESQMKAVKNALTSELSVIQGPPGTGKTHIGLVVMKLLLANRVANTKSPVLVVCYTNHALDQFLEGISEFHPNGIIRVGGRCKNKNLEKYTLALVKRHQNIKAFDRRTFYHLRNELREVEESMDKNVKVLEASRDVIINLSTLQSTMPFQLFYQFGLYYPQEDENSRLLTWLGLHDDATMKLKESVLCSETLSALSAQLLNMGFDRQRILHAMAVTGEFREDRLLEWLLAAPVRLYNREPETEMVYEFLQNMMIPFHEQPLLAQGFNKLEISCAHLVTGSADPMILSQWLHKKAADDANDSTLDGTAEDEEEIDEDAELIQELRMLDDEYQQDSKRREREVEEEQKLKLLIDKISAQTFTKLHGFRKEEEDENGWQITREEKRRKKKMFKHKLTNVEPMSRKEANNVTDIMDLRIPKRWRLYRLWVKDFHTGLREDVDRYYTKYNQLAKSLQELQRSQDREVLEGADVIGITTTGAAKYRDIIHKLPVRIVVVEEAAEVLEAHVVTSMPESTQHLILIGDHQQLKPSPTVYELAKKFNLDVSLFERMIKNGTPYTSLSTQHRMRPRIADLLRLDIYGHLQDHSSVREYEDITGVEKNVYFLSHSHHEDSVLDGRSKENQHEADFLVSFCQYLMQQGYGPEQITILTAYTGQLFAIKNAMKHTLLRGVRVTAVDNFQGEENDIILLSLVRSNEEGKIGFLRIENRICVALSRAKRGLFCIGNFEILREKSAIWSSIINNLEQDGMSGTSLPLQCKNHPEHVTQVATAADFVKVPEGGCGKLCEYRLPCGHVCSRPCHPDDEKHDKIKCRKPCPKVCESGHRCHKKCSEICGPCITKVKKIIPKCSHHQEVPCFKDPSTFTCQIRCTKILKCNHMCSTTCGLPCTTRCMATVETTAPCGHQVKAPCYTSQHPDLISCQYKCSEILGCGHACKGSCKNCFQGRLHQKCGQKCTRSLICGHQCKEPCSQNCPPCKEKCRTHCEHSKCKKFCHEPCVPCKEKCQWKCKHYQCTKLCSEPCDRPPCNRPCKEKLKCRHACIGLCGEPCPKLCRICDKEEVEEIFFGDEDEVDARFVELEDCGHVFTYQGLDKWMNPDENNDENSGGQDNIDIKLKECPRCKTPVRRSRRYGQIVNEQLRLINVVKEKVAGSERDIATTDRKLKVEMALDIPLLSHFSVEQRILVKTEAKSLVELNLLEVRYRSLSRISKLLVSLKKASRSSSAPSAASARSHFDSDVNNLRKWLMQRRANFSEQETNDLECELQRLKQAAILVAAQQQSQTTSNMPETQKCLRKLHDLLFKDFVPYRNAKKEKVEKLMKQINSLISGLGISNEEREMIVQAIGLSKGHWYKCKNGHVYCIGECGGATEASVCPECKAVIGGTDHQLHSDNRVAGEMDGATRSAFDPHNMYIPPEALIWD